MEHEVLVPLSPQTVRRSLRRPELLARCLPGFVPAEEAAPDAAVVAGRLKLRGATPRSPTGARCGSCPAPRTARCCSRPRPSRPSAKARPPGG
ncbi:hypothetical protein GXW82_34260 [Streptacidiphilus sp. 4-A2]|nr:hypothetical protein [Streptacidiphilus sp. 4-A2]